MALPRIAINGFGRIGRTIMRIAKQRQHYDVVAINDLASPEQLAYAFKYDSIHGPLMVKSKWMVKTWRSPAIHSWC